MRNIQLVVMLVVVSGCGGGASGTGEPSTTFFPGGIWQGSLEHASSPGQPEAIVGVIAADGQARFSAAHQYVFDVPQSSFDVNATVVSATGFLFLSGNSVEEGTLSGTLLERNRLDVEFDFPRYSNGSITMEYNAELYEQPSSLSRVSGMWGLASTVITIESSGRIIGQEASGCTLGGRIGILDQQYNAYSALIKLDLCESLSGTYTGLAYISDPNDEHPGEVMEGRLVILVTSEENQYRKSLRRL